MNDTEQTPQNNLPGFSILISLFRAQISLTELVSKNIFIV
jgi:hypothetical protein